MTMATKSSPHPRLVRGQVADDCAFLPLALAIAGAMPPVIYRPQSPEAWRELHDSLKDNARQLQDTVREDSVRKASVSNVLTVSFRGLGRWQRTHFLKLAVLANGVLAPMEMLCNLWDEVRTTNSCDEGAGSMAPIVEPRDVISQNEYSHSPKCLCCVTVLPSGPPSLPVPIVSVMNGKESILICIHPSQVGHR